MILSSPARLPRRLPFATASAILLASMATAAPASAEETWRAPLQLEAGATFGVHFFSSRSELGVADDPGYVPHAKTASLFGLRGSIAIPPYQRWLALEAEAVIMPTADSIHNWSAWVGGWRLHAIVNGPDYMNGKLRPFALVGAGAHTVLVTEGTEYTELTKDTDAATHLGVGARYKVTPRWAVRLDARTYVVPSTRSGGVTAEWELSAGVAFAFGTRPSAAPPPPPSTPAVPLVKDTDRDDIPDLSDKCPSQPEDKDGFQDGDGCPDPDNDQDGIVDTADKCPAVPETKNGVDDEDGCPDEIKDKDGDGLTGDADKCPEEAEDKDGFQDEDGCPDTDNDQDGVLDNADKCPTDPETRNSFEDEDGCPDHVPEAVQKFTGVIKGIGFRRNSADIKPSSFPVLKQAVQVMKEYPTLRIEISGHTSDEGKRDFNMKLSKQRAESVKAYLVSAGVAPERIRTVGYGPDKPMVPNISRANREKNRRIEFRLLAQDETEGPSTPQKPAPSGGAAAAPDKPSAPAVPAAPSKTEPPTPEPAKAEPPKAEPPKAEPPKAEPPKAEPPKASAPPKPTTPTAPEPDEPTPPAGP